MSSLIVEVCTVDDVFDHPKADRMKIAKVKGWTVCIKHDPDKGESQFAPGDKCVYFPPDTVIPHTLSDRLGVTKYLGNVSRDAYGNKKEAGRIKVAKLRGYPSYGLIIECEQDWETGTNVAEYYGASKWEPPMPSNDGEADVPHPAFHKYYNMENIRNFPTLFQPGEEVVVTEKIHGMNCRLGLIKDSDKEGNPIWRWMAGSHDVRRKASSVRTSRFDANDLVESMVLDEPVVEIGQILDNKTGEFWRVDELIDTPDERMLFRATRVTRIGEELKIPSEFWTYFNTELKRMMMHLSGCGYQEDPDGQPVKKRDCHNVVVFGERYGAGVQKGYWYGHSEGKTNFRAFDITMDGNYLDFETKMAAFKQFGVDHVPVLFQGPFNFTKMEALATGPSTLSEGPGVDDALKVGREGVVITSHTEGTAQIGAKFHGRRQLKCINFDYLDRKGGTEYH